MDDKYLLPISASKNARWVCVFITMVAMALGPKGTVIQARELAFFSREENRVTTMRCLFLYPLRAMSSIALEVKFFFLELKENQYPLT